uniref:Reverse transcriptase domain-containing protein n=1 Tax=Fagus sylvatica TaxID=28930 RepID=A0A2N9HH03_FAGSY
MDTYGTRRQLCCSRSGVRHVSDTDTLPILGCPCFTDADPWTLRGAHLILKFWEPNLNWNEIDFSKSTFWIQVHGLPSLWQNKPNLTRIGNKVGTVIEVDLIGEPPPRWFPIRTCPGGDRYLSSSKPRKLITNSFGHKIPAFGPWMRSENEYLPPEIYAKPASGMTPPSTVVVGENTTTPPRDQAFVLDHAVGGTVQVCPSASTTVREPPITSFLPVGPGQANHNPETSPGDRASEKKEAHNLTSNDQPPPNSPRTISIPSQNQPKRKATPSKSPNPQSIPSPTLQKRKATCPVPEHLDDHEPDYSKAPVAEATYFDPETVTIVPPFMFGSLSSLVARSNEICSEEEVRALKAQIRGGNPRIVFLSETKANEDRMQVVAKKIGFQNFIAIGPKGRVGGVCLFWENDLELDFYGPPYKAKRLKAWINLRALLETIQGPWLCCGDFNVMMDDSEKEGGVSRGISLHGVIVDGEETPFVSGWTEGITNIEWRLAFPKANVIHLGAINSDHCPLLIDTNPEDSFSPRPFRFEAVWAKDPRCYEVINQAWKKQFVGSAGFQLFQKQRVTAEALKHWNKMVFGHCQTRISELTTTIEEVQANPPTEANLRLEAKLQCDLNGWLAKLEIVWKQKSRELWLKEGNRNSKFFHLSTIIHRRRNAIDVIKGDNGVWIVNRKEIKDFVVDKFQDLFTEDQVMFPAGLEQLISPSITDVDNDKLCSIPTPVEIKEVVFGMYSDKAPGPDGLPALFYKRYWSIVGKSVCDAVLNFFKSGHLLTEVNNTFIVLIPKTQSPSSVNHYRPISLCNTVYKIIAKILVSRIRPVLDSLISPCQSAFIPDRWIVENQLIVQEILHSFKKRKVKGGFVALKVDLQKAYDRVNWSFLKEVLYRFGFHEKFIMWIMQCVTKVSFSILINGGKTKSFIPSRGLRQGDPLSPYLFILCQEVLSRLIERSFASGAIHGVKMNTNGPAFTHVMYADDLMLFAKATTRELPTLVLLCLLQEAAQKISSFCKIGWNQSSKDGGFVINWMQQQEDSGGSPIENQVHIWLGRHGTTSAAPKDRNSLCIKALRNKYKVDREWMHREAPKNASPTWRAIERLKALISKGACYIVGDGARIDIWKDPWVPWLPDFLPKPRYGSVSGCLVVACLINQNSRSWNLSLLHELFDETSVDAITKIPIPSTPSPDKLVWIHEPKGLFSVKVGHGNPKCPLCLTEDESIEHLFFKCNFARAMWFGLSWALRPDLINVASCSDIVELVVNPPMRPGENSCKSLKQSLELRMAEHLSRLDGIDNSAVPDNLFWMAPPADVTKLNTDVAVRGNRSTIAVIARGESGAVVKAWAKVVDIEDPLVAEAIAIKWALELAESESFPNVIVESDSKICIDNFSDNSTSSYWKIDALIPDVHRLALHFLSCCFAWVKREANMVAHELAQSFSALSSVFSCNATSLPPSVFAAWKRDLLGLSLA